MIIINRHKGWFVLFIIVITVLACLGFGRFSLGAIIPFMKSGLSLDYKETGLIASSVFLGYLIAVAVVGYFVIMFTAKRVITFSLVVIAIGMILNAMASGFWIAYIGCFVVGLGTGGAYVPSLGLVSQWFAPSRKGMAMGIAMSGAGVGIAFSGFVVPAIVSSDITMGWRYSWYILAAMVFLIAIINFIYLINHPKDVGMEPIGGNHLSVNVQKPKEKPDKWEVYKNKLVWTIGLIYMAWGFSYLVFSTFLVDYLISDLNFSKGTAGSMFAAAGFASIISGFIWGSVSDRLGRMYSLTIVYLIQFLMLLGLSYSTSKLLLLTEIIIYGASLWGVPTVMNASVGDFISSRYVPVAMGFITLFFSLGQFISPIVTGYIIETTSGYFYALILSAVVSLIGGLGCIWLQLKQKKKASVDAGANVSS